MYFLLDLLTKKAAAVDRTVLFDFLFSYRKVGLFSTAKIAFLC